MRAKELASQSEKELLLLWSSARLTVNQIPSTLEDAARRGGTRTVEVYAAKVNVHAWHHFFKGMQYDYSVPDYAQYVFDYCEREGLNPHWNFEPHCEIIRLAVTF